MHNSLYQITCSFGCIVSVCKLCLKKLLFFFFLLVCALNCCCRALGEIADRDILEKIVYDFEDEDMLQVLILFFLFVLEVVVKLIVCKMLAASTVVERGVCCAITRRCSGLHW
jgi:hypothetical protein